MQYPDDEQIKKRNLCPSYFKCNDFMNSRIFYVFLVSVMASCDSPTNSDSNSWTALPIEGTWQLISGTIIENGDTTMTDYTREQSMIKIINATHFAFLNHDLKKGKDSITVFAAGGGTYTLTEDQYTEYLEYCSYRDWEGNTFQFTVTIQGDTLTQRGTEKIDDLKMERLNIEKYVRVKDS
jgi:hypothetical protein